jgi:hypothetical protein
MAKKPGGDSRAARFDKKNLHSDFETKSPVIIPD